MPRLFETQRQRFHERIAILGRAYLALYAYAVIMIMAAFLCQRPSDILEGSIAILISPSQLITDYLALGGLGAAFLNSGLLTLMTIFFMWRAKIELSGSLLAAILTVSGFAFFGKNLFNTAPLLFGTYLYAKLKRIPFSKVAAVAIFSGALGPLVSYIAFDYGSHLIRHILLAYGVGIFVGLIMPALSNRFLSFHEGFNLFNSGFTAGIVGMFAIGVFRHFNHRIIDARILYEGSNFSPALLLYTISGFFVLLGIYTAVDPLKGIKAILNSDGRLPSDFTVIAGTSSALINMGFMGLFICTLFLSIGVQFSGPIMGGIMTMMGFSAYGTHLKNTLPVILGVFLAAIVSGNEINGLTSALTALFACTLAPIAGHYGSLAGLIAGFVHMVIVVNLAYLHGGVNLYNNGFSGGFVAAALFPIFDEIEQIFMPLRRKLQRRFKL